MPFHGASVITLEAADSQGLTPRSGARRASLSGKLMSHYGALVLACAVAVPCTDALGQLKIGADMGYRTRYVWRGLTYVDGSVIQPAVFAALSRPSSVISAGLWTIVDVSSREKSAFGVRWFGERNVWIHYTTRLDPVDVSAGWSSYFFNLDGARGLLSDRADTHEIYGAARVRWGRLMPGLTGWYDIGRVKGFYLVGELAIRVPMWNGVLIPVGSLWVTGKAGLNAGQSSGERPEQHGYFSDRGVTHYEFSISTVVGYMPMGALNGAVHLEAGWIRKRDARTRLGPHGVDRNDRAFFFGLTLTGIGPRCRPAHGVCP